MDVTKETMEKIQNLNLDERLEIPEGVDIPALYVRWGQVDNIDDSPVQLPIDEYMKTGELLDKYIVLSVWLGSAPSEKHKYLIEKA